MKIAVIGSGYVGLVSGACFSDLGFQVACVDVDQSKIDRLNSGFVPIYEPGLEDLLQKNKDRLSFTTNLQDAMNGASVIMIAVGTPTKSGDEGDADLTYVFQAAADIAKYLTPYQVIVTKSTVPVGTGKEIKALVQRTRPDLLVNKDFDVASNPEFLREGSAISDFMKPDRVVIGTESDAAYQTLSSLYRPLSDKGYPVFSTNIQTAELIKYAANGFLAMKIAFINQMADLCESVDGRIADVSKAIGLDKRIGPDFLNPGPGYGGSCFPKDTKALAFAGKKHVTKFDIIEAVIEANDKRKYQLAERLLSYFKRNPDQRKITVLGITFKANTDDLRDASSLVIIPALLKAGLEVCVYDPLYHKTETFEPNLNTFLGVRWASSIEEAVLDSDAVCLLTEWDDFKSLDWSSLRQSMRAKKPLLADYRNLYIERIPSDFYYMSLGYKDRDVITE